MTDVPLRQIGRQPYSVEVAWCCISIRNRTYFKLISRSHRPPEKMRTKHHINDSGRTERSGVAAARHTKSGGIHDCCRREKK